MRRDRLGIDALSQIQLTQEGLVPALADDPLSILVGREISFGTDRQQLAFHIDVDRSRSIPPVSIGSLSELDDIVAVAN